jgi:hypothetical protein
MMKMYYGYGHGFGGGPSFLCTLIAIVVFIDLVLLGVWLWQRIKREERDVCAHAGHKCGEHGHEHGHDHNHDHEVKH